MADFVGGGGGGFDYVQDTAPSNPKAGESWLDTSVSPHVIKVYNGANAAWDAVATASDLSAHESAGNPHSDSASATDFNNHTSDNSAHHSRYTDSEAANAAPVQSVVGKTGDVSVGWGDVSNKPSSTQGSGQSGGYVELFQLTDSEKREVNDYLDEVRVSNDNTGSTYYFTIYYGDGTTSSHSEISPGESITFSAQMVDAIENDASAETIMDGHYVALPDHSHSI